MHVYFIQNPETGLIKIGKSKNVFERIHKLMADHRADLRILGVIKGDSWKENELHRRFAKHNNHLEWFNPEGEILKYIGDNCRDGLSKYTSVRPTSIDIYANSRVRELAEPMGIDTYSKLAWIAGVHPATARNTWYGDISGTKLAVLIKVSRALGCTVDDLFEGNGEIKCEAEEDS